MYFLVEWHGAFSPRATGLGAPNRFPPPSLTTGDIKRHTWSSVASPVPVRAEAVATLLVVMMTERKKASDVPRASEAKMMLLI